MEITRESVNEWLETERRSQGWLAEQCGLSKQAVSNWLREKNPVPISAAGQITIRRLMEEDAAKAEAKPPHSLVLEFDDAEYAPIERAALAEGKTIREWSKDMLNAAAGMDVESFIREYLPRTLAFPITSKVAETPRPSSGGEIPFWIDLRGGVAAGSPITADVVAEPVPSLKEWPEDHYALRVFGQSMQPKVPDGSMIVVKEWPASKGTPRKGTIVVYADGHGATLKEFGYRKAKTGEDCDTMGNVPVLRSINPAFPAVETLEGGRIEAVLVEVV